MGIKEDFAVAAYRSKISAGDLRSYRVVEKESDLRIASRGDHSEQALAALRAERAELESYIAAFPNFLGSLEPVAIHERAPAVVRMMAEAGWRAQVGPMAAVAGALAERVGTRLLTRSPEVLVENGGDVFARVTRERVIAIDAGPASALSWKLGIRISPDMGAFGVCTSSGTHGGSLSFGRADAACAVASSAALADAAATAIGNCVSDADDIEVGLTRARTIAGLRGAIIIVGNHLGAWGNIELVEIA